MKAFDGGFEVGGLDVRMSVGCDDFGTLLLRVLGPIECCGLICGEGVSNTIPGGSAGRKTGEGVLKTIPGGRAGCAVGSRVAGACAAVVGIVVGTLVFLPIGCSIVGAEGSTVTIRLGFAEFWGPSGLFAGAFVGFDRGEEVSDTISGGNVGRVVGSDVGIVVGSASVFLPIG